MRIKITFAVEENGKIDFNYQHQIQALIYNFLAKSNPDYASWLHEEGYVYKRDQKFKMFVYSGIIFHKSISLNRGFAFKGSPLEPFTFSFQISSPVDRFIQHLVEGVFAKGQRVRIGNQIANVLTVESLADPLAEVEGNSVLLQPLESPIFVKKPMPQGERDVYLFPENEEYSEFLNNNLTHKYETLYGKSYEGDALKFRFLNGKGKRSKTFTVYKGNALINIKGTLRPFEVEGSGDLIKLGIDCGFGQNNSLGCGYVEVV